MNTFFRSLLFWSATVTVLSAQTVADPVADFVKNRRFFSDDKILRLDIDLNHDGKQDVFLACTHSFDRQGYFWSAWTEVQRGEYRRITDDGIIGKPVQPITFGPGFYYGRIPELHRYGIVTYFHGGGGTGAFLAIFYDSKENKVVQVPFAYVGRGDKDQDQELWHQYYQPAAAESPEQLKQTPMHELEEKYTPLIEKETFDQAVKDGTY